MERSHSAIAEWRRSELSFPIGSEAGSRYDCAVSALDGEPVSFKCPMVSRGFRRLDWLGVVGHGTRPATFYLDDVQIPGTPAPHSAHSGAHSGDTIRNSTALAIVLPP